MREPEYNKKVEGEMEHKCGGLSSSTVSF